jgi:cobalt-zinc-cadmium efflux system protein
VDDRPHDHAHSAHDHGAHRHLPHAHAHGPSPEGRLAAALALTVTFMIVEACAGWLVHSLALLSDAGHMLADSGALALALVAQHVATRPRTTWRTYGFRRAETLAALANGVALGVTAVWVIVEAIERLREPAAVLGRPMLAVAVGGLVVNGISGWLLARGSHNTNTRAALAHVVSDALGSIAAIVAALLVLAFGWTRADAVASLVISALILWGAGSLVSQTVRVLMEGVPPGVVLSDLDETIRATPGVADVHDLHAWTISDGFDAVTVHVVLDGSAHGTDVAREVGERIRTIHKVTHVTVQPEAPHHGAALRPAETLLRKGKS